MQSNDEDHNDFSPRRFKEIAFCDSAAAKTKRRLIAASIEEAFCGTVVAFDKAF